MADVTLEISLSTDWTLISDGLAAGTTYVVDIMGTNATAYWADTDDETAPTVGGHPISVESVVGGTATYELTPKLSSNTWLRVGRGTATAIITQV